ncbi:GNAT family N-acetyltransferase, partial [Acinetobacter baumannii]
MTGPSGAGATFSPDRQGRGLGRRLIAFADAEARRLGLPEIRLYTHVTMTGNIALYGRTDRRGRVRQYSTKL